MMFLALLACSPDAAAPDTTESGNLMDRAYVVSSGSNEMFVFDYKTLEAIGSVDTTVDAGAVNGNHMAMVGMDGRTIYTTAAEQDSLVIIDAATLKVKKTMAIGTHATHMAFREGTAELWIMAEDDNAVVVLDTETDTIARTITDETLDIPHFARLDRKSVV